MSLGQLTDYLLWKSIKHETPSTSGGQKNNIKHESSYEPDISSNDMMCRVCRNTAEIPITEKIGDTPIINAIRMVANISISEGDHYPKYVCKVCLEELKIAFQFKNKCLTSDMMFRKTITSQPVIVADPQPKLDIPPLQMEKEQLQEKPVQSTAATVKKDVIYDDDDDDSDSEEIIRPLLINMTDDTATYVDIIKKKTKRKTKTTATKQKTTTKKRVIKVQNKRTKKITSNKPEPTESNDIDETIVEDKKKKKIPINKCRRCELTFETKEELQTHQKEHNNTYRACPLCGKVVLHLASHERLVHTRTHKYTCHECGKVYYSSVSLSHHMRNHKETKGYFCDLCPYKGQQKSYLANHIKIMHSGEHRYLCSMCPKRCSNLSNLKKHTLVHFSKKFECSKCKKLFRRESSLKEHFDAIHLHIKYRCSVCGKDLSSRTKLLKHERRIHKREKHKSFGEVQKVVIPSE